MDQRDGKRSGDDKLAPTERRFQQLLAAEGGHELFDRILRMVLMAKAQGVPVNYEKLEIDLKYKFLSDRTKTEWATAFWAQGAAPATEEGA
jgi:CRISPR system Cascade subunit CasB